MHVLRLVAAAGKTKARALAATNALVLTRAALLHATQHLGAVDLAALTDAPPGFLAQASADGGTVLTGAAPCTAHSSVPARLLSSDFGKLAGTDTCFQVEKWSVGNEHSKNGGPRLWSHLYRRGAAATPLSGVAPGAGLDQRCQVTPWPHPAL